VAATLAKWPGISGWLCGSLVVYQTNIKHQWLGIASDVLEEPTIGPVSKEVTGQLACKALELTPGATLAIGITGHLGPGAPEHLDGLIFVSLARRHGERFAGQEKRIELVAEKMFQLKEDEEQAPQKFGSEFGIEVRADRMLRAVAHVLTVLRDHLQRS
jgi:nicotinamide mononucleotide (NMN) deamidase PncC